MILKMISWFLTELKQHRDALTVLLGFLGLMFFLWRNLVLHKLSNAAEKQAETAQESYQHNKAISEKSQVNDQYIKSIDQLGSNDIAVKLGGIYGLEQVAKNSEQYYQQVIEVFTAYIREHARQPDAIEDYEPSKDIQVILTILGRVDNKGHVNFDLSGCYLKKYSFKGDFSKVNCTGADFSDAIFDDVNFSHAVLYDVSFDSATFFSVNFSLAYCEEANFSDTDFNKADFNKANCNSANFRNAYLSDVDFSNAYIEDADFTDATIDSVLKQRLAALEEKDARK